MSVSENFHEQPVGHEEAIFLQTESSYKVISGLSGAVTVPLQVSQLDDGRPDIAVRAKRSTLSELQSLQGKHDVSWSFEAPVLIPTDGSPMPDWQFLFAAAGLTETIGAGVSYTASNNIDTTLSILQDCNSFSRLLRGAYVEKIRIYCTGSDYVKYSVEGKASDSIRCGTTQLDSNHVSTDVTLDVVDASVFEVGAYIRVGADDNSGAGFVVDAIDTASSPNTVTLSSGLTTGVSSGDYIGPYAPTPSYSGKPPNYLMGTITVDGVEVPVEEFDLTIDLRVWNDSDRVYVDSIEDYRATGRSTQLKLKLHTRRGDSTIHWFEDSTTTYAVVITIGDTSGQYLSLSFDNFRSSKPPIEVAEEGALMHVLEGECLEV